MPYIKFGSDLKSHSNSGSCQKLVDYLEKEDKTAEKKKHFFNEFGVYSPSYVIQKIDNNKGKLSKKKAKFYTFSINFSKDELKHISGDTKQEKIENYTKAVMDDYAKQFDKGLLGKDLLWFAKIETNRFYKGYDPEVRYGVHQSGDSKPGDQTHVHIIVSRIDRERKHQLSPMTKHRGNARTGCVKGSFSRINFFKEAENTFDVLFNYQRNEKLEEKIPSLKKETAPSGQKDTTPPTEENILGKSHRKKKKKKTSIGF